MLGSLINAIPLFPLREDQDWDRKSTSRAGVSRVSRTFLGPSSADRWHRAGRRYLKRGRRMWGKDCEMTAESKKKKKKKYLLSSLPQSFFACPRPSLLTDRHISHPLREALLWALTLQVAPGVADQKGQQSSHFFFQTGSLLSQPWAQRAECGKDKRVTIATWIHLREQEETSKSYKTAQWQDFIERKIYTLSLTGIIRRLRKGFTHAILSKASETKYSISTFFPWHQDLFFLYCCYILR